MVQQTERSPDHDLLVEMKGLQLSFIRETGQKFEQVSKDVREVVLAAKDSRAEIRDDICKHDKRLSSMEKSVALIEQTAQNCKDDRQKLRQEMNDNFIDFKEFIEKEDEETREELRRSIVTWSTIAGLIGAAGGVLLGVLMGIWIN